MSKNALFIVESIKSVVVALAVKRYVGQLTSSTHKTIVYQCDDEDTLDDVFDRIKQLVQVQLAQSMTANNIDTMFDKISHTINVNDHRNHYVIRFVMVDIEHFKLLGLTAEKC